MLDIYSPVGIPEVISNQGTQFTSEYKNEFFRLMGSKQLPTTPYHAITNGLVERFNDTQRVNASETVPKNPDSGIDS